MFFRAALTVCFLVAFALFATTGCAPPAGGPVTSMPASVTDGSYSAGITEAADYPVAGYYADTEQASPGITTAP